MFTRKILPFLLALALLLGAAVQPLPARAAAVDPELEIVSVRQDRSVTLRLLDFPADVRFDVYMYPFGQDPDVEDRVANFRTTKAADFELTFDIPKELKGVRRIAIFMESRDGNYDVETWFLNRSTGRVDDYTGFPSFTIAKVVKDREVTLRLRNLPPDDRFRVRMDEMGTQAKDGIHVGWINTGDGGNRTATFTIPAALRGETRIAIRIESPTSGYFYYNWFFNRNSQDASGSSGSSAKVYPSLSVLEVVKDQRVDVLIGGIPKGGRFVVLMAAPGTNWKDAIQVISLSSPKGGLMKVPLFIPAQLKGASSLLIRVEHTASGSTATVEVRNVDAH